MTSDILYLPLNTVILPFIDKLYILTEFAHNSKQIIIAILHFLPQTL